VIKVLIVDDSAVVRKVLSEALSQQESIEVVGTAADPYSARDKIAELRPDVITLDIEMPRMDGLTFLEKLMTHFPLPVIIVSSLTPKGSELSIRALALGACDVVPKPGSQFSIPDVSRDLSRAIRTAALARFPAPRNSPSSLAARPGKAPITLSTTSKLLAIGSSTGGPRALEVVLGRLGANAPGTVIVQHMPEGFTRAFAERLNGLFPMQVREAQDGETIASGTVLIAPGRTHLFVQRSGAGYVTRLREAPPVNHHRPSVDVLFHSVAKAAGANAVGVILTGMGRDGAEGLLAMRNAGAHTIAQDEQSSVVYGMPREAAELGAAVEIVAIEDVARRVRAHLSQPSSDSALG
jgi:two-component system, chemotaxis family, protein-glutamate methylesterase/glutaminase